MNHRMNRRDFLGRLAVGGACLAARPAVAATSAAAEGTFRFLLFADIHFSPGEWANDDPRYIDAIYERAERENCQMIVQLGDMVHSVTTPETREYVRRYNDFHIPTFHVMGNHDADHCPLAATMEAFRMEKRCYYHVDRGGYRFIVLDPNYTLVDGKYVHHEHMNYFKWMKTHPLEVLPPEQLAWLRETVLSSPYPCVVLSHESLERPRSSEGVWNKEDVQAIFREANAASPHKVLMCACGHHHIDNLMFCEGIPHFELNGANFFSCGRLHDCYPAEYVRKRPGARRNLAWTKPLSAVVTLGPGGSVRYDGMQADYLFGVTGEKAGFPSHELCKLAGRCDGLCLCRSKVLNQADKLFNIIIGGWHNFVTADFGNAHFVQVFTPHIEMEIQVIGKAQRLKRILIAVELFLVDILAV